MKKILIGTAGAVGVAFAVLLAGVAWLVWALPDLCANEVLVVKLSPDGKFKAVVFQRDCGATTDFSTQVSVLRADDTLENEGGNVFSGNTAGGVVPSGQGGDPVVVVSWVGANWLKVEHRQGVRIFKMQSSYRGIDVNYRTFDEEKR